MWSKYLQVDETAKMNEQRVKSFASVSSRSGLCSVKRHLTSVKKHLKPVVDAELLVQRITNKISPEPIRQIFEKQVLAKVLTPGEFELKTSEFARWWRQLKQTLQMDLQLEESTRIQSGALSQPR